jgi:hypothetical protein
LSDSIRSEASDGPAGKPRYGYLGIPDTIDSAGRGLRTVRMMSVAVLSAGLVVAGACASAGGAGDSVEFALEPGTTYAFSGSARGAHHHENRRVAFMVPVNGELMILGELSASMPGSHGAGGDRLRVRRRGRSWTFACDEIRFELFAASGTATGLVSVLVEQEYEHRGECIAWRIDAQTGQRLACTSWAQARSTRRVWSDPVSVAVTVR